MTLAVAIPAAVIGTVILALLAFLALDALRGQPRRQDVPPFFRGLF